MLCFGMQVTKMICFNIITKLKRNDIGLFCRLRNSITLLDKIPAARYLSIYTGYARSCD